MAKFIYAFVALGCALASAQQIPQVPQHTDPAVLNYNPFVNPNVPGGAHHQNHLPTPPPPQAGIPPVPQHTDPKVLNYNPFVNPNLHPNSIHHQPAPVPQQSGYNPFHNPHVPAHLYQQQPQPQQHYNPAPTPAPAPRYNHHQNNAAPQVPQVPQHTDPAVTNYNPFYNPDTVGFNPFHNPNVPANTYDNAPNTNARHHHQPAPAPAPQPQYPGSFGPAGTSPFGFSHPNSIPGANNYNKQGGRGPIKVSASQQPQGFTYNFETS